MPREPDSFALDHGAELLPQPQPPIHKPLMTRTQTRKPPGHRLTIPKPVQHPLRPRKRQNHLPGPNLRHTATHILESHGGQPGIAGHRIGAQAQVTYHGTVGTTTATLGAEDGFAGGLTAMPPAAAQIASTVALAAPVAITATGAAPGTSAPTSA